MICCAFEATICSMQRVLSDLYTTMFIPHFFNGNNNYLEKKMNTWKQWKRYGEFLSLS